jgi:hypothetical protein
MAIMAGAGMLLVLSFREERQSAAERSSD